MALPTLQLGDIGTPRTGQRRQRQVGQEASAGPQPQAQAAAPQTFAQMQANGMARPAPPPQNVAAPPRTIGPSTPPPSVQDSLQQSVTQALTTPSPYNSDTFNSLRTAARNDLTNEYGKIRETTDTNLARRGLSASSFGANEFHDVDSAQSRAMADIDAKLLGDAATTEGTYRSQANAAGQNYVNSENSNRQADLAQRLAETLGLGNLDLSRQAQTNQKDQFGQTLAFQKEGAATQQQQFMQQLMQQLGIAQMGDKTANRGIDSSVTQNQIDLILKLAGIMGIPTGSLTGATGSTGTGSTGTYTPPTNTGTPPANPPFVSGPDGPQGGQPVEGGGTTLVSRVTPRGNESVQGRLATLLNGGDSHAAGGIYSPSNLSPQQQSQTVEHSDPRFNGMSVPDYLKGVNTPGSDVFKAQGDPIADSSPYFWNGTAWTLKQQGNGYQFDPSSGRYVKAGG